MHDGARWGSLRQRRKALGEQAEVARRDLLGQLILEMPKLPVHNRA
jgi:hypothetical protein